MDNAKLIFWCNNDFGSEDEHEVRLLKEAIGERRLLMFAEDDESDAAHNALRTAHVAFGYPSPAAALQSENLQWIQLNSAGYTTYDHDEIKQQLVERRIVLTNSSSVYDEPCAQHLLAMITGLARQLPAALDSQRRARAWEMDRLRALSPLLNEQTVLMLGFGAIGRRLVELLLPLRMNLMAVRRHVKGDEPIHVVDVSQVDELLPVADHVVNILPANEQTKHFLNATRLGLLKRGAIVYNIGRGVTLDQEALKRELDSGRLGAAYLDVTDPEPLPPDHPLWTTPNCYITPHSGGGHSNEKERQVKHFLENLRRFELREELIDRVW
jgi:phosphoglycerate dehydrogenase-like enzyme